MSRLKYLGIDKLVIAVHARAREIQKTQYNFKLPKQTKCDSDLAEIVAYEAKKIGINRRHERGPINEAWIKEFSIRALCCWAMHPEKDVFADLLEILELTDDGQRVCFPGVTPDQVDARKELIGWALDSYATYLISQKRKAGTHPLG